MHKRIYLVAVVTFLALTGCATETSGGSMGPGTHKLQSTDEGTWRAPGSKDCKWAYEYKIRHNAPVQTKRGGGYSPAITISALGVRFTSDNCGTFKR
jgi:hypothetical protein